MVHPQAKWIGLALTPPGDQGSFQDSVERLREALDVYLSGRSGIRFESLARFAGPIFDFYDIDWRSFDPRFRDRDEVATMVAVLDAARLLWAFFSLDDEEGVVHLPELEDAMLGRTAGEEERSNLLLLLSLMEEHWQTFTPEDRRYAEAVPGFALPDFATLLSEFDGTASSDVRDARYGPERLSLPEAIALFAEPLLQDVSAEQDPDLVEQRMARAQAYWDLAQAPQEEFESELQRLEIELADDRVPASAIRSEALEMVERYRRFFAAQ